MTSPEQAAAAFVEQFDSCRLYPDKLELALAALVASERAAVREACVEEVNSTDMDLMARTLIAQCLRALPLE